MTGTNRQLEWIFIALIIGVYLLGAIWSVENASLRGEEPRRAVVAFEALENDDYLNITTYGVPYYNKPPLFFWFVAKSFEKGEFNRFFLRLPGQLSIILSALVIVLFFKRRSLLMAFTAAILYLSLFDFLFYQSIYSGEMDHLFSLLVFLSFYTQFKYLKERKLIHILSTVIFCFLAFLTKGLPSIIFFLGGLLSMVITKRISPIESVQRRIKFYIDQIGMALLLGAFIAAFFSFYHFVGGDAKILALNLLAETKDKSVSGFQLGRWIEHVITYPLTFLKYLLPWVLLLPLIVRKSFKLTIGKDALLVFALTYTLVNLIPYWISYGSRGRYVLCLLPVGIIVIVRILERVLESSGGTLLLKKILTILQWFLYPLLFFSCLVAAFLYSSTVMMTMLVLSLSILGLMVLLYKKQKEMNVLTLLLSISLSFFIAKAGLSQTLLKRELMSEVNRKEIVNELLNASEGQPIRLSGALQSKTINVSIGGFPIQDDLYFAVVPSYEIPYFYILGKGESMRYQSYDVYNSDELYLIPEGEYLKIDDGEGMINDLYCFYDDWTKTYFYLIKNEKADK